MLTILVNGYFFRVMKGLLVTLLAAMLLSPLASLGNEGSDSVIVYPSYPDGGISYIYVIPGYQGEPVEGQETSVAYVKQPVFKNKVLASRNYRQILCTKYTICD